MIVAAICSQKKCLKLQMTSLPKIMKRLNLFLRLVVCPVHRPSPARFRVSSFKFQNRGFTLLEILIALFIFGVIVTTIFGSFKFVFGSVDAVEKGMTDYDMAKDCFNRMIGDLHSLHVAQTPAYQPPENAEGQDPYRIVGDVTFSGESGFGRLRFTSLAHVALGKDKRTGIAEITYYAENQTDGSHVIKRSDRLDFAESNEDKRNDPILCENVRSLEFTFINSEGEEGGIWDSDSNDFDYATPRAIRIKLTLGTGEYPHTFETMVVLPQYREAIESRR
jgi:general secretion pathway protein J